MLLTRRGQQLWSRSTVDLFILQITMPFNIVNMTFKVIFTRPRPSVNLLSYSVSEQFDIRSVHSESLDWSLCSGLQVSDSLTKWTGQCMGCALERDSQNCQGDTPGAAHGE